MSIQDSVTNPAPRRTSNYEPTGVAVLVLAAIDAGARDVYDINVHITDARGSSPDWADFSGALNELRFFGSLIRPCQSPRDPRRIAYERGTEPRPWEA